MPIRNSIIDDVHIYNMSLVNLYECEIGKGTKIGAFVEIGRGVVVGSNCKIQAFVFIPEGVCVGDNVFIGPNVTFCNVKYPSAVENRMHTMSKTIVKDGVAIGAGSVILPGVTIGCNAIVGAGSVVTKDVDDGVTVKGNPAR